MTTFYETIILVARRLCDALRLACNVNENNENSFKLQGKRREV
jgi:hypothetical protein